MQSRLFVACVLIVGAGCSVNPSAVEAPVNVSGKITTAGGKPVGSVTLNLQPLENGYMQAVAVQPNGSFTVQTTPGKYAYFLTRKRGGKATPADLAPYSAPSLQRTVVVAPDQPADIELP